MFGEELLNNVMERYNKELEVPVYRRISKLFVEEHLKLLKKYKSQVETEIVSVSRILENLGTG